jgi:branched-chain amino acid transport system substrate-binding protein
VRFLRSTRYLLIVTTLLAAALLAVACEGEEEEAAETPEATSEAASPEATAAEPTEAAGEVPGVTDTEILLGTHYPLSGNPAAAYAPIAYGMKSFFDYINGQGGVYGRNITLLIEDDHYNPPDTLEVVRKLVEQDEVFAIVGGLGEETHNAIWKYLEEEGVPDMFVSTGLAKWTDPVVRTRFGGNPDYVTEGEFLADYIAENYAGKKLGLLLQNDQLGEDGEKGLRAGLEGSDVEIVAIERYEAVANEVTAETQRLQNAGVDVIVMFSMPVQGASLVRTARETLNWDVPIITTGINCSDIFISLAGPENVEGMMSYTFGHQAYETELPGTQKYMKIWDKTGTGGPLSNFALYGMFVAELTTYIIELAGPDLTRDSFLDAAESVCGFDCTTCFEDGPVNLSPTDHRISENLIYNVVENGNWRPVGDVVSLESTTDCEPPELPPGFEDQPKVGKDAEFVP